MEKWIISDDRKLTSIHFQVSDSEPKKEELICGICLEDIPRMKKKFGLLKCKHSFCFDCITEWRNQTEVSPSIARSCPECRKPADTVVMSDRFVPES